MHNGSFWQEAANSPERVAIVEVHNNHAAGVDCAPVHASVRAGELLGASNRIVHGLRDLGLRPGDAFAVMMPNQSAVLELYLAATQAGLYFTPINRHLTASEVAYILQDSDAKALFCSESELSTCEAAVNATPLNRNACFASGDRSHATPFRSYEAWKASYSNAPPTERRAGAPMTYTSGTTGRPKGVRRPLSEGSPDDVAARNARFLELFGITQGEPGVHLVTSPLYHTAVLNFCMNHLHLGHTVVVMEKWTPQGALDAIARHGVTATHMVPTQFRRLLAAPAELREQADVASLRHVIHSAAPCPVDVKRRMLAWWGPVIYEYYAASEGGGTMVTPDEWLARPGTVGKAWPFSEIEVRRGDATRCNSGEIGTVYIAMNGVDAFAYYKDAAKTKETYQDKFFTVGDAGYLDEDGYLYLSDRKSDMIISGGVNIYPAEIEAVLISHPNVVDAAVFGIPDDDWGERIQAVIEVAPTASPGPELESELGEYCKGRLARFKCPKSFDFVVELPRDPNGKLYKRRLRDPYWKDRERLI